nr:hypothetical protein HK105_007422 [Polyrhizophydium stewartii]
MFAGSRAGHFLEMLVGPTETDMGRILTSAMADVFSGTDSRATMGPSRVRSLASLGAAAAAAGAPPGMATATAPTPATAAEAAIDPLAPVPFAPSVSSTSSMTMDLPTPPPAPQAAMLAQMQAHLHPHLNSHLRAASHPAPQLESSSLAAISPFGLGPLGALNSVPVLEGPAAVAATAPAASVAVFPQELSAGLNEIARHSPHNNFSTSDTMADVEMSDSAARQRLFLKFVVDDENLPERAFAIQCSHTCLGHVREGERLEAIVSYRRKIEAFRALGHILGAVFAIDEYGNLPFLSQWSAQAQFETMGVMIDCSRAAVLRVDGVFYLLRNCALMGLCTMQLYTEDTFALPGEPFFGFMRGGFTEEEMRAIDDYAFELGIEVFPSIQTLGHLGQMLQWPVYTNLRDTSEVLLVGSQETYDFIRKMVTTASSAFRSRRIHIGMDEANGVGEGRYRQLFGSKESIQIYLEHLQRVAEICREEGLQPLLWSDMLFTLMSQNGPLGYYDETAPPADLRRCLPPDIQLVYWDYYHTYPEIYMHKIQQHRDLGFDPWVASAVWTWNRFFSALPFTFDSAKACMLACKQLGVRHVVATLWGDDGNECDMLSALPGLAYFGEQAYTTSPDVDWATLKRNFAGICGGRLEDWIYASKLDSVPHSVPRTDRPPPNPSKWILWQDPLYSFLSPQYAGHDLGLHFSEIAKYLFAASSEGSLQQYPLNYRLRFPALLARTLSLKCDLRERFVKAYSIGNPAERIGELQRLVHTQLRPLRRAMRALHHFHRTDIWLQTFKPFGLEILEMRYGALRARLETMEARVWSFCRFHVPDLGERGSTNGEFRDGANDIDEDGSGGGGSATVGGGDGDPDSIRVDESTASAQGSVDSRDSPSRGGMSTAGRSPRAVRSAFPAAPDRTIPEFEVELPFQPFPGFSMELSLDFARSYTPSRALGTG